MAFDFPNSPTVGQQAVGPNGTFTWDGAKWTASPSATTFLPLTGGNLTGPITVNGAPVSAFDLGRNKLHNGLFNVQQRGQGPWTASGNYTADRWNVFLTADTNSVSVIPLADADRTAIGDEGAVYALQDVFAGSAAAGASSQLTQPIEGVRRLNGKTVIVSFWARAASGSFVLGLRLSQTFGTGGSPSAPINLTPVATPTLTTTWQRYTATFTLPSAAGKTLGTNGNDSTSLNIGLSSGSTSQAVIGIGVQSGTVQLWGVQLEVAAPGQTLPSPLEKPDPRYDLANCQRFYQAGSYSIQGYGGAAGNNVQMQTLINQMRAQPTLVNNVTSNGNVTLAAPTGINAYANGAAMTVCAQSTAAGAFYYSGNFTASADL